MTALPSGTYDNPYFHDNVYGHAVELLQRQNMALGQDKIHLDIGCGYARIAEALIEVLGVHYVGVDNDDTAIGAARSRGLEIHAFDLDCEDTTYAALKVIVGNRQLACLTMLDTLEHLSKGNEILSAIRKLAAEHGALVVISVPNVTHADIGLKLAFGSWDYTDVGLLDHTHVRLFSEPLFRKVLRGAGLHVIEQHDVRMRTSDQHFPCDHPALAHGTTLHTLLSTLRQNTDATGTVNQFVRLCVPGPVSLETPYTDDRDPARPFLSVIIRTLGTRNHTLQEALTCLTAQTDTDFEVVVVAHRVTPERRKLVERVIDDTPAWLRCKIRLLAVDTGNRTRPLNKGFDAAAGHYIAILDDDDIVKANWVETFKELATAKPGRLLRTVAARQTVGNVQVNGSPGLRAMGAFEMRYPSNFDFIQHLRVNLSPPVAVAFPRGVFHDLNIQFDETLTTTEDWDYIMRVAGLVGVVSSEKVTCVYRWWLQEDSSRTTHSDAEWHDNHQRIFQKMDHSLVLFPEGTTARIRILLDENDQMKTMLRQQGRDFYGRDTAPPAQHEALVDLWRQIHAVLNSTSWKISAPIRLAGYLLGRPKTDINAIWRMTASDLAVFHDNLLRSTSWRLTSPLRRYRTLSRVSSPG